MTLTNSLICLFSKIKDLILKPPHSQLEKPKTKKWNLIKCIAFYWYCRRLYLFAPSIAESLLDDNTQLAVNRICKQTTDTKFCSEVFANKLISSSPSKKDLMNVTVTEAERFSANTYFFISTLLRNAEDERPNLQMCAEAYAIVNTMFRNAVFI